ncbi:HPr family phosphocarrier protein [Streptobacillus moniliformis]|uniref:Phosphotransferase system, phosphocarrier protein HPr n=1 Tax=Streptobacillus moniliformis (strain ATCC 14647 / DSM 12112 / NCTC 10651 / 9901) TaxID=519441 RepID=D1AVV1_STRM9|nr:HPr family phosphocarrier protein [Streptobacillus moniliformis]ACZ01861.1 Phosphotransferase system, phosphocarrier protein HPr [Streptobacillus moniliformis DSM 12112]AVL43145.1 HPr family phosphocarrier protein [Streptobacillus moniliformis]SQA12933.1 Phosphocarrier protein HPr [Streptobacillus moniliformis]
MNKIKVKVLNEQGIHARPSTKICAITNKFSGNVFFRCDGENYDAKNIMTILLIGLEKGREFEIIADSGNEKEEMDLLNSLQRLIEIEQFN